MAGCVRLCLHRRSAVQIRPLALLRKRMHSGPGASVKIVSISCDLQSSEVYEGVEVSTERNAPTLRIVDKAIDILGLNAL